MDINQEAFLFDTNEKRNMYKFIDKLYDLVDNIDKKYERIAFICIGSDRCTGDCFGPLVGYNLSKCTLYDFDVYGTINTPVHAKNLVETINKIDSKTTLIIALDSSLGCYNHVGFISMGYGGIKPGSGVGKDLPCIGDIFISGIVNISGFMPTLLLQNTSLGLVFGMAEVTSNAIKSVMYRKCFKKMKFKVLS